MQILKNSIALILFIGFAMSSCSDDQDPKPMVLANAGPDQKVNIGKTITLDGTGSKDSQNKTLTYLWTLVRKPQQSEALLTSTDQVRPVLSPDKLGEYEMELTVTSETGTATDRVLVTVEHHPTVLTHITAPTVLEDIIVNSDLADYWANEDLAVDASLTIKPGVVIGFAEDAMLEVNTDGSIVALGEGSNKITLTGKINRRGYWRGIIVYSNNSSNKMLNVDILNAGSKIMLGNVSAALTLTQGARLDIQHTKIADSKGYGINFMAGSIITNFVKNFISNNDEAPVLMTANHAAKMDRESSFSNGNERNAIEIIYSALTGNNEVTWTDFTDKTPYRFLSTVSINTGLKLSPGVIIEVSPDNYFDVDGGYINAVGTTDKKIVITGVDKTASSWAGIILYSRSNMNVMKHVKLLYAGNIVLLSDIQTSIALTGTASLLMEESEISHSGGYALTLVGEGTTINSNFKTVNTFTNNALGPIGYKF